MTVLLNIGSRLSVVYKLYYIVNSYGNFISQIFSRNFSNPNLAPPRYATSYIIYDTSYIHTYIIFWDNM